MVQGIPEFLPVAQLHVRRQSHGNTAEIHLNLTVQDGECGWRLPESVLI